MSDTAFLEYIESTGAQYIDTGILPTSTHRIVIRCRMSQYTTNYDTIFGTRNGDNGRYTLRYGDAVNGKLQAQWSQTPLARYSYITTALSKNLEGAVWHSFDFDGRTLKMDGAKLCEFTEGTADRFPYRWFLFAVNDRGMAVDFAYMQMSGCRIYNGSRELLRDYYPVRDGLGRVCLYDAVSGTFTYDASGSPDGFTAGPELDAYAVRFDNDNGAYAQLIPRGEETELAKNAFIKSDFLFYGWDENPEGATVIYEDEEVVKDLGEKGEIVTLYPVWKMAWAWLIKDSNNLYYTIQGEGNRERVEEITALTAEVFQTCGFQGLPPEDALIGLPSPTLYRWDAQNDIAFKAVAEAIPDIPQGVTFETIRLERPVKYVNITGDGETLWNVSFDNGVTWYSHNGEWIKATREGEGCVKRMLERLPASDWASKTNGTLKFRCWLGEEGWVQMICIDY